MGNSNSWRAMPRSEGEAVADCLLFGFLVNRDDPNQPWQKLADLCFRRRPFNKPLTKSLTDQKATDWWSPSLSHPSTIRKQVRAFGGET